MTIGEKIREIRTTKKISQTALATATNISKQSIYKYETGIINNIPFDKIEKIANALGVTPAYLMGWDDKIEKIIEGAAAYLEKENKLNAAILEMYGLDAMEILDRFIDATDSQKATMLSFVQDEKHTHDLFSKYYLLDDRGKKTVENVILAEYKAMNNKK